jgi:exosortase
MTPERPLQPGRPVPWIEIGWFALLLAACYAPVLRRLAHDWMIDADMGHGFFVPLVALYIVWQRRDRLLRTELKPNPLGYVLVILGAVQLIVATLGVELFLARTAFLVSLAGILLAVGGWPLISALLLPLVLLIFMVPIPAIIYNQITFPLQLFASRLAESILTVLGVPVIREGNILDLPSQRLSVVEACSGIRSLLSLTFLSLVYAHFLGGSKAMMWILLALTPPIAITVNALRVTLTGILGEWDPELAKGLFHSFEGWVMFLMALAMLVATHRLLVFVGRRLFHAKPAQ